MKDYPFDFNTLFNFSNSDPYLSVEQQFQDLFVLLNQLKTNFNFPAINNDVGCFINFLIHLKRPQTIFEMGSGYGHSSFWYMQQGHDFIKNIYLTEKRDDLKSHFEELPWPSSFKEKIEYFQGDAFDLLHTERVKDIDFLLIDGVKADYLKFLEGSFDKLSDSALILVDNSYWRGSFLDEGLMNKKSAKNILELHEYIQQSNKFQSVFVPFKDGVSLLRKLPS